MKNVNKVMLGGLLAVSVANAGTVSPYASFKLNQTHITPKFSETDDSSPEPSTDSPLKSSILKDNFYGISIGGGAKYNLDDKVFVGAELNLNYNAGKKSIKKDGKKFGDLAFSQLLDLNLLGGYNVTKEVSVYALVGASYTSAKVTKFLGEKNNKIKYDSVIVPSVGLGTAYNINQNLSVKLEYNYSFASKIKSSKVILNGRDISTEANGRHSEDIKLNSIQKISLGVNYNF